MNGPAGISAAALAAAGALAAMLGLIATPLAGLLLAVSGNGTAAEVIHDPYVWHVARFTVWQAFLSTLLSTLFAIPVARALARRNAFPGRALLVRLLSLPLALPQLVAVLGILSVWGSNGWLARASAAWGGGWMPDIYGLPGILIAHVFFNMPLMVRLITAALERVPGEYWRLAAQLGMSPGTIWRLVEWPAIRAALPGAAALVFMLCATSYTVVLVLGGGPGASTLEVAIYEALRFEFDPPRAVALAMLQLAITATVFLVLRRLATPMESGFIPHAPFPRLDGNRRSARLHDAFWLLLAATYIAAPLAGIVISGLAADLPRLVTEPAVHDALRTSLLLAATACLIALLLTWALLQALRGPRGNLAMGVLPRTGDLAASLVLIVPPVILGAGWFVILMPAGNMDWYAPLVVAVINALMSLPFSWRVLQPAFRDVQERHGRLCAQLGLRGFARLRLVDWPLMRRPLGLAAALALALSLGDLGAIALFGSEDFRTLPWLLYQRLGSYRTDDAAGLALALLVLIMILMTLAERAGRRKETS